MLWKFSFVLTAKNTMDYLESESSPPLLMAAVNKPSFPAVLRVTLICSRWISCGILLSSTVFTEDSTN